MITIKNFLFPLLVIVSSNLFSQSYLPLELNNTWYFNHGECIGDPVFSQCNKSTLVSTVRGDSIMPNGNRYFAVNGIFIGFYEWFRSDTNWIYVYSSEDSLDLPIINLHAIINEPYVYGEEEYQTTILRNRDTMIIFNDTIEVLDYVLETGLDLTNEFTLSSKYGFIKYDNIGYGGWSYSNLIGCMIDGVVYGDTTTVGINDWEQLPSEFILYQNYPNPFNPVTTIKYSVLQSGMVAIKVYNILGVEISTLVNEYKSAGNYEIEFNANNLTSGVYLYALRLNNFDASRKMTLLK